MTKDTLKIVIIGHVDHGKSTLIGRLLLETKSLPQEKIAEIKKVSRELGKDAELAYLADQLKEERERNQTIDTTQIFFKTSKRNFVIIDTPGHVELLKNMLTGASEAQSALLIIDIQEGLKEQTKRHAYLINMLGITQVNVIFNKMDLVGYREAAFEKVKNKLLEFFRNLKIEPIYLIPLSAKEGVNISIRSSEMKWYRGPTLLEILNSLPLEIKSKNIPLRFSIQDAYKMDGEKIMVGKVISGKLKERQRAILLPSSQEITINYIRVFGKPDKKEAKEGENIGVILKEPVSVKRGDFIVAKENPPKLTGSFQGNIFWLSQEPLQINKPFTLRCATQEVECVAEKIEKRINSSTLEIIEKDARELKLNEAGLVRFKTVKPIVIERFFYLEDLGRFIIESGYNTQGAGIII